ncbi:MAG: nitroreductase family deazaflavin-dependent oxidoreductase [bacterium]
MQRLADLVYYGSEYLSLGWVGSSRPSGALRSLYRAPAKLYAWGLGGLVASHVLLLTTTGRKSGLERRTPIGYIHDPGNDVYFLTAGWKGHTDWKRNLDADPAAAVQVGRRRFRTLTRPATDDEARWVFAEYRRRNPFADRLILRDTGIAASDDDDTLRRLAEHYPVVALPAGPR